MIWGRKLDLVRLGKNDDRQTKSSAICVINELNFDSYKSKQLIPTEMKVKRTKRKGFGSNKPQCFEEVAKGFLDFAVLVAKAKNESPSTASKASKASPSPSPKASTKITAVVTMPTTMQVNVLNPVIMENDSERGVSFNTKATTVLHSYVVDLSEYIGKKGK